ncbi:TetR family transcriptional regulator C-terminal domain-containing protein [Streptomyces sp. Ru87]|uniref:TetR family transcriptional regulator C-terminal domain-containing protein n=1 Tax=Streptomyces sp. Ru87 TaxID=2044307 RepID=UPI0027B8E3BC|nr:TetR family transcriptional regulator C-terminal domain-containing protein [Streptomyces sp. Ru87]
MPLDDARRAEFLVRLAFADQAAHNARLTAVQRGTLAGIRARVAQAIRKGTVCGEVAQGIDAADQALRIVACTEGLALPPANAHRPRRHTETGDPRRAGRPTRPRLHRNLPTRPARLETGKAAPWDTVAAHSAPPKRRTAGPGS